MYCKNCGKEIDDDSSFCPYCGSSVNKKICDRKETSDNKGSYSNGFGISGFIVSIVAILYCHAIIAVWYAAFALALIGIVLSCAGMKEIKKGKNGLAFAGFIIGAIALFECGDRWLGFSVMILKCNGYI